jgi:hypothetical protein
MPDFASRLEECFPGSLPAAAYLDHVAAATNAIGMTPDRTLALVSICRDELTRPFANLIDDRWGNAFTLAGLGGVPELGRTGWGAAFSHIPNANGRGGLIVFGFPHIGIEDDGTVGVTIRQGQRVPTATCGALSSICAAAAAGELPTEIDYSDYEATSLAMRLVDPTQEPPDLVSLTRSTLDALETDLWRALDEAEIWRVADVTVWCGVQVHGHSEDWIWPRHAWFCGDDGVRKPVPTPG